MKKLFFAFSFLFAACSGEEKNNLSGFTGIENTNQQLLYSLLENAQNIKAGVMVPHMRASMLPFDERKKEMLNAICKLHNAIVEDIRKIMQDNGVNVTVTKPEGFSEIDFDSFEISEKNNFHYDKGEWICEEMEKLFNHLAQSLNLLQNGEPAGKIEYFERPIKFGDKNNAARSFRWPVYPTIEKLCTWLLIPVKHQDGQEVSEQMFDGLSLTGTLEQLSLIKQRVLFAGDLALHTLYEMTILPEHRFNRTEPVVFISPSRKDSALLLVGTLAYDTTELQYVRYSVDGGPEKETRGMRIVVPRTAYEVNGVIGMKRRGELVWRPWKYVLRER